MHQNKNNKIRKVTNGDLHFLKEMLFEAAYWRVSKDRPNLHDGLRRPDVYRIMQNWGMRDGDTAIIAENSETTLGAAWYRFWTKENHSFGFVNQATPELGIAVVLDFRGKGIGRSLIRELVQEALIQGVEHISLSVEKDNPAQYLYISEGFKKYDAVGNAWTMILDVNV